jgi:hypothetical protein
MSQIPISLLYTTARPQVIDEVVDRWFRGDSTNIDMVVVTDDPYEPPHRRWPVRYFKNDGRRDCVTGWNLAAQHAIGDIFIQVSDDLFPPVGWESAIRQKISRLIEATQRKDIVLNLLDERRQQTAVYHPVLTKSAYEKTACLYPPDFQSMFCDNWFFLYHRQYSVYEAGTDVFWHHKHRTTHPVEIDEVTRIHEGADRYQNGRATLKKYVVEHKLKIPRPRAPDPS